MVKRCSWCGVRFGIVRGTKRKSVTVNMPSDGGHAPVIIDLSGTTDGMCESCYRTEMIKCGLEPDAVALT